MRVFVSEYCVGGAAAGMSSRSMRREGMAMLRAVIEDIRRLPDWSVVTTLESGILDSFDCDVIPVESGESEASVFSRLIREVDAALIIAPETGGILADRCRKVRTAGIACWNCTPESIELCGDKLRLAGHFQIQGIPTISTGSVELAAFPDSHTWPAVLKPRDGAGSYLTFLIRDRNEWDQAVDLIRGEAADGEFILQPQIEGRSLSVGVIVSLSEQRVECLPIAEQRLSNDGRFSYLGGRIPAEINPQTFERIYESIRRTCQTIPGLAGYVGFDLILKSDETFYIVEINPRLTTSYVGYRQLYSDPLPGRWLAIKESVPANFAGQPPIEFSPDGQRCGGFLPGERGAAKGRESRG